MMTSRRMKMMRALQKHVVSWDRESLDTHSAPFKSVNVCRRPHPALRRAQRSASNMASRSGWQRACGIHDFFDQLPDLGKPKSAIEKSRDSDFIGRVHYSRQGAAGFACAAGEIERRKILQARRGKLQFLEFPEIERWQRIRHPIGPGDGVLNRKTHVGMGELREDGAVGEFDH